MLQKYFLIIFLITFFSCANTDNKNNYSAKDSVPVTTENKNDIDKRVDTTNNSLHRNINMPPIDTNGLAEKAAKMKKAKVEIKVFRNTDISGYGYDIILEGHTYVHQPNIPAIPGNNGFATEEKARKVAELVAYKIRNNIMPPTVEIKELDSLGVK